MKLSILLGTHKCSLKGLGELYKEWIIARSDTKAIRYLYHCTSMHLHFVHCKMLHRLQ